MPREFGAVVTFGDLPKVEYLRLMEDALHAGYHRESEPHRHDDEANALPHSHPARTTQDPDFGEHK